MGRTVSLAVVLLSLVIGFDLTPASVVAQEAKAPMGREAEAKGKTCRMEQQCHWENFKKICTYVKVCR